jgi:hypothetical protein
MGRSSPRRAVFGPGAYWDIQEHCGDWRETAQRNAAGLASVDEPRLAKIGVRPGDLTETFTRSGGAGGQNVNKVATAVLLVHRPSGVSVRCTQERSQGQNRLIAPATPPTGRVNWPICMFYYLSRSVLCHE